jgi:hypothetical protein
MPKGKYKGVPVNQVPPDYLRWVLAEWDECQPDDERYWPEFTSALEALVGPSTSAQDGPEKRRVIPLSQLCGRLRQEGITLQVRDDFILPSRLLDPELAESVRAHGYVLLPILALAPAGTSQDGSIQIEKVRYLLRRWYGEMSRRCHPDMGGSSEKQACVNECYRSMVEVLRGEIET